MWIELDKTVAEYICNLKDSSDDGLLAVEEMFNSMRKKQHIVFAGRDVLDLLLTSVLISVANKDYIQMILDHYFEIYAVKTYIKYKVVVRSDICSFKGDDKCFIVPLKAMVDVQRARLLVENESDGKLYKDICNYLMLMNSLTKVYGICFENDSYSGSGAGRKIEELTNDNRMILCIVDSDKHYPDGASGSSSRAAKQCYQRKKNNHIISLYELNAREKENLLSPEMYQVVNRDELVLMRILMKYPDEYMYFDIKDGIKHKRFRDERWKKHYTKIVQDCKKEGIFLASESEEDQFIHIKGIGDKQATRVDDLIIAPEMTNRNGCSIIERMHHYGLSENSVEEIVQMRNTFYNRLSPQMVMEWKRIYELVFSYGCSLLDNPGVLSSN